GSRRDKPIIEFDPEIEKTLKKNRSRVKAQRTLQFEQEEVNSEEGASENSFEEECIMADNANNQRGTLADYTNPTTTSCGSSIVWPNVVEDLALKAKTTNKRQEIEDRKRFEDGLVS
ncbi:hypothetical protein PIB30_106255, partial [Stylosanthes scabra]|nr:hypothetical protein [Stylosanthes scabra]